MEENNSKSSPKRINSDIRNNMVYHKKINSIIKALTYKKTSQVN